MYDTHKDILMRFATFSLKIKGAVPPKINLYEMLLELV